MKYDRYNRIRDLQRKIRELERELEEDDDIAEEFMHHPFLDISIVEKYIERR